MRGIKAKRLRKLGLKSGPKKRAEHTPKPIESWHRTTALIPNPVVETEAEAKRQRRRERNIRNGWRGAFAT
jgi:hypothetical protein